MKGISSFGLENIEMKRLKSVLKIFFLTLFFSTSPIVVACDCNSANLDGIGRVDFNDLALFTANWLSSEPNMLGDINKDQSVDFIDFQCLAKYWLVSCDEHVSSNEYDIFPNGILTRNSIAYLNGVEYPPNMPRYKTYAVCGPSDLNIPSTVTIPGVGNIHLVPYCIAGGYLYASESRPDMGAYGIYRSADGVSWTQMADSNTVHAIAKIFGVRDGSILISKFDNGFYRLYKSSDGGATLSSPKITFDKWAGNAGTPTWWSYHQAKNGTIMMDEYQSLTGGTRKLWRSVDDGNSFNMVYEEPNQNIKHSHRIIKHEPSGRWLVVWGDGALINKVSYSDDDGITWADLEAGPEQNFQPVEFLDVGDSNRILYGSDASEFVGWYNVYTHEVDPLYTDGNWYNGGGYVFSLFYYNGVYYAGTFNVTDSSTIPITNRRAAILVSNDLTHWTVYHQFTNGELGITKIIGVVGGKIQAALTVPVNTPYNDDHIDYYCYFSPTTVSEVNSVCIDPATTNLLSNNIRASVETDGSISSDWSMGTGAGSVLMEPYSQDALQGNKSLKCTAENTSVGFFWPKGVTVKQGAVYSSRISVKALDYSLPQFCGRWFTIGSNRGSPYFTASASKHRWMEMVFPPAVGVNKDILICQIGTTNPVPYSFLLDCAQIEPNHPSRWQIPGVPRAYEKYNEPNNFPSLWTNLFVWSPESRAEWYANCGNQYIKTWYAGPGNYIELYFNPNDCKFYLQATVDGFLQNVISTSQRYNFYRNSNVCFAVSYDDDSRLNLSVGYAGLWSHKAGLGADMMAGIIGSQTGNYAENNVMSGALLIDEVYERLLAPSEIEKFDFTVFASSH